MKKEELKEFIEGTIIPNKIKGITATMLKEVLLEVADSLGEGGGGGGYAIFCNYDVEVLNSDDYKDDPAAGIVASNLLTPEQLEHNKQCFEKIIAEINSGKPMPSISIDISPNVFGASFPWNTVHTTFPLEAQLVISIEGDGAEMGDVIGYPYIWHRSYAPTEGFITKDGYCCIIL